MLNQEEDLGAMKSRVNWMIQGDWNTAFYHVTTLMRRKRNKILSIKDYQGEWINDQEAIMVFIQDHFRNLFASKLSFSPRQVSPPEGPCPCLSNSKAHTLSLPVLDEEIRHTLWLLKPCKSPGPDGIHTGFYQRFWPIVGNSVIFEVKEAFRTGKVPPNLNQTLIALIPEIKGPETIGNYRPISLCNFVYKVITKIIITRIRPFLEKLVSPFQSAFVPGRKGLDNAIMAQEIIHSISRKRGNVGYMVIKINVEKAMIGLSGLSLGKFYAWQTFLQT